MCHDEQGLASVEALFKTLTLVLAPATNLDDKKPGAAALALNRGKYRHSGVRSRVKIRITCALGIWRRSSSFISAVIKPALNLPTFSPR